MINDAFRVDWIIQTGKMLCEKGSEQNLKKANIQDMNKEFKGETSKVENQKNVSLKYCKMRLLYMRLKSECNTYLVNIIRMSICTSLL
jgi:hypothetical protein